MAAISFPWHRRRLRPIDAALTQQAALHALELARKDAELVRLRATVSKQAAAIDGLKDTLRQRAADRVNEATPRCCCDRLRDAGWSVVCAIHDGVGVGS